MEIEDELAEIYKKYKALNFGINMSKSLIATLVFSLPFNITNAVGNNTIKLIKIPWIKEKERLNNL